MSGVPEGRPWLVMVTGEPGSGKTSLGRHLAGALRLPFLSRDEVRGGLLATAGLWTNDVGALPEREEAVEAFVQVAEKSALLGISSVLEFVVFRERAEALRRLESVANCLVVLTTCTDARARAEHRDRADGLLNRPLVLEALGYGSIEEYIGAPQRDVVPAEILTEFDLPLLRVATDHGNSPPLSEVVQWVIDQTRR